MQDDILKEIQLEYPFATKWEMDTDGSIRVQMSSMDLLGGIAGDIEIYDKTYFLKRIFPVDTYAHGAQLIAKFEEA